MTAPNSRIDKVRRGLADLVQAASVLEGEAPRPFDQLESQEQQGFTMMAHGLCDVFDALTTPSNS